MSRGTFGSKIASEILSKQHDLTLLHAKDSKLPLNLPQNVPPFQDLYRLREYITFDDYEKALTEELKKQPDIIILAAAVSDYGVENYVDGKIRSGEELIIRLKPLPKLISRVREQCPKSVICGFKLLVNSSEPDLMRAANKSLIDNKLDLVVGNDLRDIKAGQHKLMIVERNSIFNDEKVIFSVHQENLPNIVVRKCLEHYQLRVLR